ncbi:MAG: hypothetical protein ABEI13_03860 [Candidatus Paceibacteria bacterium]
MANVDVATQMQVNVTKRGLPALWESGGGFSNTGNATIICGKKGEAIRPVYIRRKGQRACSHHALIAIKSGYHVIKARHHNGDFDIDIYRVENIDTESEYATLKHVNNFSEGEWDQDLSEYLHSPVDAARKKARDYHCRDPYFIKVDT